jgi:hypothetical protein
MSDKNNNNIRGEDFSIKSKTRFVVGTLVFFLVVGLFFGYC